MNDQTPDDQAAVQALAEAMAEIVKRERTYFPFVKDYAPLAIQAIRDNPDILRSMGFGRLPTRSEVERILDIHGLNRSDYRQVTTDLFVNCDYAIDDPAPAAEAGRTK